MTNALLTDLYQLTMMAAYAKNDMSDDEATFDMFIRKLPKDWGYYIAAGIEDAIDEIINLEFDESDIEYLREQNIFEESFLEELTDFKFDGEIYAVKEGEVVFPNEPLIRITGKRSQVQLLETLVLNTINYQTMIASKASRVVEAAKGKGVADFGLRRAQGEDAAMKGARAAYIAGCIGTSNVKAGKEYGIPIIGTHAHSFVMSFDEEIDAFRAYADTFPDAAVLLIDTYDTVEGAKKAAIVGQELAAKGHKLKGVRLDSGDLIELSKQVRTVLDDAGLEEAMIFASNDLNEYKIAEHRKQGAQIDAYGVGTELITAKPVAAIPGVYKLVEDTGGAKMKLSPGKKSYPGKKQIFRYEHPTTNTYFVDVLTLEEENAQSPIATCLLEESVRAGRRIRERPALEDIRNYSLKEVKKIYHRLRRIRTTDKYEVSASQSLQKKITELSEQYETKQDKKTNTIIGGNQYENDILERRYAV